MDGDDDDDDTFFLLCRGEHIDFREKCDDEITGGLGSRFFRDFWTKNMEFSNPFEFKIFKDVAAFPQEIGRFSWFLGLLES